MMTLMKAIGKLSMQNKQPQYLSANWNAPSNIKTLITTRLEDFNLAMHVNDDIVKVQKNRDLLNNQLPTSPFWLNQTHSTTVINWDNENEYCIYDADASITTKSNAVCIVMTADCLPILLTDKKGSFVAAIHAGWRGLNNGIIENTLDKIRQTDSQEIIAFIGPAINQECFEVGEEVLMAFTAKNVQNHQFFIPSKNTNKYLANLRKIAELILINQNIQSNNIFNSNICTQCNDKWFYSYRKNSNTGRFATMIWKE